MIEALLVVLILVTIWNAVETRLLRQGRFWLVLLLPAEAQAQPVPTTPAHEVAAALADARRLAPEQAKYTRYLSLYNRPAAKRDVAARALCFHINNLSREADLAAPRKVSDTLYAVEIDTYGWEGTTYGKLFQVDPWFHAQAEIEGKRVVVHAPWLVGREIAELVQITGSVVPILRADWFVFQTGEQLGRKAGYYDFLGLKKLSDAEKLAGLDRATATRIRKEMAAIVAESSVALNNRQIFRLGSVGGSWWETRDAETSTDKSNAIRQLDGDYQFNALEIYFTLPNGLFGLALANNKGELIETAPDKIASDGASTNSDRRVHVGLSCIRCHTDGLRAIDDYARKVFRAGNETALGSPDREKARRLKQLYLGPLQESLAEDRAKYAKTLFGLTGWTPAESSRNYASEWAAYESGPILPTDAARELGCAEADLLTALRQNLKATGATDLALAGFLTIPPVPIRREQFEEQVPVLMGYLKGAKP